MFLKRVKLGRFDCFEVERATHLPVTATNQYVDQVPHRNGVLRDVEGATQSGFRYDSGLPGEKHHTARTWKSI